MGATNNIVTFFARPAILLSVREKVVSAFLLGVFVFLFLLLFQPFGVNNYDPNESITSDFVLGIFVLSLSVIVFSILNDLVIFKLVFSGLVFVWQMFGWLVWSLCYYATILFLLYNLLGNWHDFSLGSWLEFLFNLSITAILPLAIVFMYLQMKRITEFHNTKRDYTQYSDELITIQCENQNKYISLFLSDILFLSSEDNYVAVHYLKSGVLSKHLVRTSLKRLEDLQLHHALVRCHRSYLVNLYNLNIFKGNAQQGIIFIRHVQESIPVSKSYAKHLVELLK